MTNHQFLVKYCHLLENLTFQKLTSLHFTLISYSELDSSIWWNLALTDQVLNSEEITHIEQFFKNLGRQSTIYFENRPDLAALTTKLQEGKYTKTTEDSWMFYSGPQIDSNFDQIKRVESSEDLEIFMSTFDLCYQKDDPQNPYGEQHDYLKIIEKSWKAYHDNGMECFIVYDGSKPVAVSTLNSFEELGYISNVGSIREARGKGYGKLATLYALWKSQENGNSSHCLATEEGTYPNEFYKRLGFQTKFTGLGYSQSTPNSPS